MNWEAIGSIGELIGAAGVVVSLAYLAVQIRQNTVALRITSYQDVAQQLWQPLAQMVADPSLVAAFGKNLAGEELDPEERGRLTLFHSNVLFGFENLLRLHELGFVDRDTFDNAMVNSKTYLLLPDVGEVLAQRESDLSTRLRSFVDQWR
jgi:hypothetical protein